MDVGKLGGVCQNVGQLYCDFMVFFPTLSYPSVVGGGEATGGETMWRLCSALALLALCLEPCDSQTSEHGGFLFHFSAPGKKNKKMEKPSTVITNHMGFLFHLIQPQKNILFVSALAG